MDRIPVASRNCVHFSAIQPRVQGMDGARELHMGRVPDLKAKTGEARLADTSKSEEGILL